MNTTATSLTETTTRYAKDTVARLQKSEVFRDYQQAFESLTGLPLTIRPVGDFHGPTEGSKHANAFCVLMAATNKTCAACLQLQEQIEANASRTASTLQCFAGLSESAVPIRAGDHVIGYLQTGQVFLHKPSKGRFKSVMKQLVEWGYDLDFAKLEEAYMASRVMTLPQYQSILRLITIFAEHLSTVSNQLVLMEASSESPVIVKARNYINERKTEDVTLADVAKHVNMSAYYFCKVFRKSTGSTFTDYLARIRSEFVKQLLLNPHKRISEAAFEAGFQSLSQFNRIFRRITGESPTDYRHRIHAPASLGAYSHAA
jgi:AraC-like DNA-binding protein/ligand-binding sensor protein